jgi:co-chaperonin GroES (HSP10)
MKPEQFKPLRDGVLVCLLPSRPHPLGLIIQREHPAFHDVVSKQTDGTHGDYRHVSAEGIVVSVGPGKLNKTGKSFIPTTLKPGDNITFTAGWDDLEGAIPGHVLIQEADVWWLNAKASDCASA